MAEFPTPTEGIVVTHFIVSGDVDTSRRFYTEVLGGETVLQGEPSIVALSNSWIIINVGGGPTDDKPTIILETPTDPDRVSAFLNIRVADTSPPPTRNGVPAVRPFSRRRSSTSASSAATCATPTAT